MPSWLVEASDLWKHDGAVPNEVRRGRLGSRAVRRSRAEPGPGRKLGGWSPVTTPIITARSARRLRELGIDDEATIYVGVCKFLWRVVFPVWAQCLVVVRPGGVRAFRYFYVTIGRELGAPRDELRWWKNRGGRPPLDQPSIEIEWAGRFTSQHASAADLPKLEAELREIAGPPLTT